MSDKFFPLSARRLLEWILEEEKQGSVFGLDKTLFYRGSFPFLQFGEILQSPLGVAAGPHTQMAQNIITAWLAGARYIELKTVQVLDDLEIKKPCIHAEDEGYNWEWSQELNLTQSFEEYLKAWILIHLLQPRLNLPGGFHFNMSVGYDLQGILSEKMQTFLDRMENCRREKEEMLNSLSGLIPVVDIRDRISTSVTLSTMHGCPPDEIEKIGAYLIKERKLHTMIKLNPTLLGPQRVRKLLNQDLGYDIQIPDEAFDHDLKYDDALTMIRNLTPLAKESGVEFGLKLTNTLQTANSQAYLSGRALHPIGIQLAARLQTDFNGELDLSFCGGVDCFNVKDTLRSGLGPVTVCTDLLKPGGYGRLHQYLLSLDPSDIEGACPTHLQEYAKRVSDNTAYHKDPYQSRSIKNSRELPRLDCVQAPCVHACPAHQDVPQYLQHCGNKAYDKAITVILETNPLPLITGLACHHPCERACTRLAYDAPLKIRSLKHLAAKNSGIRPPPGPGINKTAAVIGAGPSGLSFAWRLKQAGYSVTLYEASDRAGGLCASVIPEFRLPREVVDEDINSLDLKILYNRRIAREELLKLCKTHDAVYLAVGAGKGLKLMIPGEKLPGVLDALEFLASPNQSLGERTAVIGGGNCAMDAARTAKRICDSVTVLYRRTRKQMPADPDEIQEAIKEGVVLKELLSPIEIQKAGKALQVRCALMEMGARSKRPIPREGMEELLSFDTVIVAIGQQGPSDLFDASQKNLFVGGDAKRGPSSLIQAIGDGDQGAKTILPKQKKTLGQQRITRQDHALKAAQKIHKSSNEASRCLSCDQVCDICVTVCPNRANVRFESDILSQPFQTLNIADLCNQCGNCKTFCPSKGDPGLDKPKLCLREESFQSQPDGYMIQGNRILGHGVELRLEDNKIYYQDQEWAQDLPPKAKEMLVILTGFQHQRRLHAPV